MEEQVNNLDNKHKSEASNNGNQHSEGNEKGNGLDSWNERLDENLENEDDADLKADEKAKRYSAEKGSGDQSDANMS